MNHTLHTSLIARKANVIPSDYINPIDLCNRLNTYILPEAAVHGILTFLFLVNGYWLALILNIPLAAWNIKK
jgi:protein cornichon